MCTLISADANPRTITKAPFKTSDQTLPPSVTISLDSETETNPLFVDLMVCLSFFTLTVLTEEEVREMSAIFAAKNTKCIAFAVAKL